MELELAGKSLAQDIKNTCDQDRSAGKLTRSILGNDITTVALRYIKVGMLFGDAENIVRYAGLDVQKRPGPDGIDQREDRHDVYATSHSLVSSEVCFTDIEVRIAVTPDSLENDYSVGAVRAWIFVNSF